MLGYCAYTKPIVKLRARSNSTSIARVSARHSSIVVASILRFATVQGIERKQDLAGLAPKGCFIERGRRP